MQLNLPRYPPHNLVHVRRQSRGAMPEDYFFGWATYPANLCPLFGWLEVSDFSEDLGQAIGKSIEAMSKSILWQRPSKHFHSMLREEQRIDDTVPADTR
jgi:hypothetical protein